MKFSWGLALKIYDHDLKVHKLSLMACNVDVDAE